MRLVVNKIDTYNIKKCPCCEEVVSSKLLSRKETLTNKIDTYSLIHSDVVCNNCGLVYTSSRPNDIQVSSYYENYHPDSSTTNDSENLSRLKVINKYLDGQGVKVLEIGGGERSAFSKVLEKNGCLVSGVEVGNSFPINQDNDCVCSYYVMEHINDLHEYMLNVNRVLKDGGYLIFEVPDFEKFPLESLNEEHVNHFCRTSVEALSDRYGYSYIDVNQDQASRYFGMLCVLKRTSCLKKNRKSDIDLVRLKQIYFAAILKREEKMKQFLTIARQLSRSDETVLVWGANQNCVKLLGQFEEAGVKNFTLVDSSKYKQSINFMGFHVRSPDEVDLESFGAVLVCASTAYLSICNDIEIRPHQKNMAIHKVDYN